MTDQKGSADAWSKVWKDAQKQYMDAWMGLSQGGNSWPGAQANAPWGMGAGWPGMQPVSPWGGGGSWADPMQQWSRMMSQALPKESRDVNTRLFDLGKSYMNMGETFWHLLQQGKDMAGEGCDWQELMQNAFAGMTGGLNKAAAQPNDPWSGFATLWGLPMDTWQRMSCMFTPSPGEMGKSLKPGGAPEPSDMTRAIRQMLAMPPVGYTREWQMQGQELAELFIEYTTATQEFMQLLSKVGQSAAERFGSKMNELSQNGESLDGLRAAYDLWVDCGEEAYAEVAATPDFPHLQAKMVNALMRLKGHEQVMMDEVMTAMNIPTRHEVDATHKRVYELQRQLCALQDKLDDITDTLDQLEDPVEAAPAAPDVSPTNKPAAPARKKTTVKKSAAKPKSRAQTKSE
jgi:class III poly(R)-hydroxyalkanoic acid synthase PhaE subunit